MQQKLHILTLYSNDFTKPNARCMAKEYLFNRNIDNKLPI